MTGFLRERGPCLAIVRRGRLDVYQTLKTELEEPEVVQVIWDRRSRERRTLSRATQLDRRQAERRGAPPEMWGIFDFVMAPRLDGAGSADGQASPSG